MTELTALAAFAATTLPVLAERIPAAPARYLGRSAAPEEADPMTLTGRRFRKPDNGEPECLAALRSVGEPLAERLLGALERPVARHAWSTAPDLVAGLPAAFTGMFGWGSVMGGYQSEATEAPRLLDRLRPGLTERAMTLTRELAADPGVAPLLAVRVSGDEPALAAAHGAVYLALAVTVAGAVIHQADPVPVVDPVAATVGLGTGIAALLLREAPLPAGYQEALLTKIRESYLMPRHSSGHIKIIGHRFGLTEGAFPSISDFSRNGLVAVGDGGVVVRTGIADGSARVDLQIIDAPSKNAAPDNGSPEDPAPGNTAPELDPGWDDVVEVSWRAAEGRASVTSPDGSSSRGLLRETPPWPGHYRIRVHARGRDEGVESYRLTMWAAPEAPETVLKRTDRLGHRLRGEPEPDLPPEHAYRWVQNSRLSVAATVTVVTGSTAREVLLAFGADPDLPEQAQVIAQEQALRRTYEQWVTILETGDAVLVVEDNGYRGADPEVLQAASSGGRAASMFWNVNALTRLSFAESGRLLASHEPFGGEIWPPEVAPAVAGLDFGEGEPGDRIGKGLVAVERFTGRGLTPADLTAVKQTGLGYRIRGT